MPEETTHRHLGRRGLLAGTGAVVAGGLITAGAAPASAAPAHPDGDGSRPSTSTAGRTTTPMSSPITTTIASNPASGVVYRFVDMYAFSPFDPAGVRTWGGTGVYTAGTSTALRAGVDIPPGSTVKEIEYYVSNSSGTGASCSTYIYSPGNGFIFSIGADVSVPGTGGSVTATKVVPTQAGPYPFGARLLIGITTPTNGSVQINGARVGFSSAGAEMTMLGSPVRVYDSRSVGRFTAGQTRTITLSSSVVPLGTTAVLANIAALEATGPGYLKAWSAAAAEPGTSTLNYVAGQTIANSLVVAVSSGRQLRIKASSPVHVILDVVGRAG